MSVVSAGKIKFTLTVKQQYSLTATVLTYLQDRLDLWYAASGPAYPTPTIHGTQPWGFTVLTYRAVLRSKWSKSLIINRFPVKKINNTNDTEATSLK